MRQTTKVLLAEDDPNLCRYLVKLMDDMNCEIAVEHNGEDAIRRAANFQPDVALVGFVMPGWTGAQPGLVFWGYHRAQRSCSYSSHCRRRHWRAFVLGDTTSRLSPCPSNVLDWKRC